MNKNLSLALCFIAALGLQACNEDTPYYKQKSSTASPLLTLGEDQRWVLLKSGEGFHGGCEGLYKEPDNLENTAFIEVCKDWETKQTEFLKQNNVQGIERAHLRDETLWAWRNGFSKKILECKNKNRGLGAEKRAARHKCDPLLSSPSTLNSKLQTFESQ